MISGKQLETKSEKSVAKEIYNSFQIFIITYDSSRPCVCLDVFSNESIARVMKKFMDKNQITDNNYRFLFHRYIILEPNKSLSDYNITEHTSLNLDTYSNYRYTRAEVLEYCKLEAVPKDYITDVTDGALRMGKISSSLPKVACQIIGSFFWRSDIDNLAKTCKKALPISTSQADDTNKKLEFRK